MKIKSSSLQSYILFIFYKIFAMDVEPNQEDLQLVSFVSKKDIKDCTNLIARQPFKMELPLQPVHESTECQFHSIKEESNCMDGYQFQTHFIYAFAKNNLNNSEVFLYSFQKADGTQFKTIFTQFNASICCLKLHLFLTAPPTSKKHAPKSKFKLLMGCADGFLRIVDLQTPYFCNCIKIDHKEVLSIISAEYELFNGHNICLALTADSQVYMIDLQLYEIKYVLQPKIVMCDTALSISFSPLQTHLMQTTQGGYIIFWELKNIIANYKQEQHKSKRLYNMFPFCNDHSVAINGLVFCEFYGNTIILVTKDGEIKIVAYIFGSQIQFVELLSYKIENPLNKDRRAISHVKFFPEDERLLLSKNRQKEHFLQVVQLAPDFKIRYIRSIYISPIGDIRDFFLTGSFNILLCRSDRTFVIHPCSQFFPKEGEGKQKKQED